MPTIIKAPNSKAIPALPGMPKASVGSNAPPSLELFAASGAITPSIHPLPNISGCFDVCLAWPYAIKVATAPPAAGIIPIITPRMDERKNNHQC